ncbi:T9SS type B sorting domain-containing protein [Flavobacterium zepuense]|uniref:T9SS type B sorting domain-containing protein n=1 Tax=Flavobacterium zepuense TaxID=2593302 RepID=A0A552UTP5_9FLAO|nr:T9SS type B sorting domain-containing protein [Flavobacterium zepuense]TRW21510.1 T9SS type B sorting domain-containing protein [Flavobacterium zepuense]
MKKVVLAILLLSCLHIFAQKEANNWYFGRQAGIHFLDDGSVQILTGSQMDTNEGCSSMSDTNGNLLFYTDGRTVWDRNHIVMPNGNYAAGTGLLGDPSSTQSGIIVPKKGDPNIYYIFTVDEPHHTNASVYPNTYTGEYEEANGPQTIPEADDGLNNGLNYSVVDLSLIGSNGSIGNVTIHNQPLLTYDPANIEEAKYKCSEKITAVKNFSGSGYWVVTHFIDKFYSFFIDGTGITTTPVISQLLPVVPTSGYRRNSIGCIKASPDGNYIAIAHQQMGTLTGETDTNGTVYLYNFDSATGVVSNPLMIKSNCRPYGLEFSPMVKKLYVSYDNLSGFGGVHQYDLEAANIPAADVLVANTTGAATMQLGPNGKIYRAVNGSESLDVINSPEETGILCDYDIGGVQLESGRIAIFGLPPFITSLFSANILVEHTCLGDVTEFSLNVSNTFDSVSWNFGDGSAASTQTNPQHTYANTGIYNVVATITREGETSVVNRNITIYAMPVANAVPDMLECDPDNNGIAQFNLSQQTSVLLGSQNAATFEVRYFTTQADADTNTQFITGTSFTNASNPQTLYARIYHKDNPACYATTSFLLNVSNTPVMGTTAFALCDDDLDGNDANGRATFDLNIITAQLFQGTGFTTTYYATEANANAQTSPLPVNYYNTTPNMQTIYARIVNNAFSGCFTIQPVTLTVNPLPADVQTAALVQCDMGVAPDGITQFNLTQADSQFTANDPNLTVAYYSSDSDAQNNTNLITGAFTNTATLQVVTAKVSNTQTGCFRILPLTLQVNVNTVTDIITLERCDDDGTEDGIAQFNLADAGLEVPGTAVAYYVSVQDALMEENAVPVNYFTTAPNQQTVYARIETNNDCTALREIQLFVRPLPDIEVADTGIVCLNTKEFITLDAGISGSQYTYLWSNGSISSSIMVNQPGIYTVMVTDNTYTTLCSKLRTITLASSNVAIIDTIVVEDLRDNNTVMVVASPTGNVPTTYSYSLDSPNGPWQESPYFENVEPGIHTLYVYDDNGCGIVHEQVAVLAIPKFFTPNGDESHDYWSITGLNGAAYYNSKLFIYDRYGKLLSDIDPQGPGWDGTYKGHNLPSTDYWFVLSLTDGRVVKGHFSMVR